MLQRNVTVEVYHFDDGDGHVGNDAMTIPDYVVIGLLIGVMLLAAARSLSLGKLEL